MRSTFVVVAISALQGATAAALASSPGVSFERQIQPLLAEKCFTCHGPDETARKADLRIDQFRYATTEMASHATPIVPGNAAESEVVRRITSDDDSERMPPADSEKTLSPEQIELITTWIKEGAKYTNHWAFSPPERPEVPPVKNASWARNDVDRFVLARLEKEGLTPSPEAAKATLLRRLSLDLIGLPPTIEELDAFLRDDSPDAYERQVDRLLASPHYGERWGRLWLDASRYADSDGYEKDLPRSVWMYRDWVVRALNRDLPYDQFITQQLAGDLLPSAGQDERIATGFLRNSTINEEGGIDPEQFRMEANFERMDILGKAVLGLTVNCCQCHTHKYDPIPHDEYYRLMAFINEAEEVTTFVYTPGEEETRQRVLAQVANLEKQLQDDHPNWRRRLAAWGESVKDDQPAWEPVEVENVNDNAQRYIFNDDKSVTGWGYNPPDTYASFAGKPSLKGITAIRLEALTDPTLTQGGPGRSPRGLFAITEVYLDVLSPGEKDRRLKVASATADYANPDMLLDPRYEDPNENHHRVTGRVEYAIDGVDETAWGIDAGPGRSNTDRKAVFVLDEPLTLKPGESLRFMLRHDHGGYNPDDRVSNTIGRFRFSVTDAPHPKADPLPKTVREIIHQPIDKWTPEQMATVFTYWRTTVIEWKDVNDEIDLAWRDYPRGATQLELAPRAQRRVTHVLERGDFLKPGKEVEPGVLSALQPLPEGAPRNRLGLAKWLTDRQAPTTARSIVNRIWQAYFGAGIVNTPEDFGTQGEIPSNPQLLDWLATDLMDNGWSLKQLHRQIVTSSTYRQSSKATPELLERDPQNRLLARGPRFRVDGEAIWDIALSASGLLNPKLGGPPVYPPAPAFMFLPPASFGPKTWIETTGPERYRRGLYTFRFRSVPYPVLTTFDTPIGDSACVRRARSNTPLQALMTLNETIFLECARALALRAMDYGNDDAERMAYAFRRCVGREPTSAELEELTGLLAEQIKKFSEPGHEPWQLAANDPAHPPLLPEGATPPQAAAWTAVSRVLLNLDETITKE